MHLCHFVDITFEFGLRTPEFWNHLPFPFPFPFPVLSSSAYCLYRNIYRHYSGYKEKWGGSVVH